MIEISTKLVRPLVRPVVGPGTCYWSNGRDDHDRGFRVETIRFVSFEVCKDMVHHVHMHVPRPGAHGFVMKSNFDVKGCAESHTQIARLKQFSISVMQRERLTAPNVPPPSWQALVIVTLLFLPTLLALEFTFSVIDEDDFASRIMQATGLSWGPNSTTLVLPANLTLSKALPSVAGPLQLVAGVGGALISCLTQDFMALTVETSRFGMAGLTWTNCGTVLVLPQVTYPSSNISIDSCRFLNNGYDLTTAELTRVSDQVRIC